MEENNNTQHFQFRYISKKVIISLEMCRIHYHIHKSLSQDNNNPTNTA